jgi:hypothetical protein
VALQPADPRRGGVGRGLEPIERALDAHVRVGAVVCDRRRRRRRAAAGRPRETHGIPTVQAVPAVGQRVAEAAEAEVGHLDAAGPVDQDVAGTQSAVRQVRQSELKRVADVGDEIVGALEREALAGLGLLLEQLREGLSVDVLPGDVAPLVLPAEAEDADQVLVGQARGDLDRGAHVLRRRLVDPERAVEHDDHDLSTALLVHRAVDRADHVVAQTLVDDEAAPDRVPLLEADEVRLGPERGRRTVSSGRVLGQQRWTIPPRDACARAKRHSTTETRTMPDPPAGVFAIAAFCRRGISRARALRGVEGRLL